MITAAQLTSLAWQAAVWPRGGDRVSPARKGRIASFVVYEVSFLE